MGVEAAPALPTAVPCQNPGGRVFDRICGELRMASLICKSKSQRFHTFAGILRCKLHIYNILDSSNTY